MGNKQKILIFHPALAPYRIDFFNIINEKFNAVFYFNLPNVINQKFDQKKLSKKCHFKYKYILSGFEIFGRSIRFGIISIIRKEDPEIVVCSEYGPVTLIVFLYKTLLRKRFRFYTISDDSIEISKSRKGLRAFLRNLISKNCNGVIFPSIEVCNWYNENISNSVKTIELPIIHNDKVFRTELSKSLKIANRNIANYNLQGKKVILFVGRLVKAKNLFLLIDTLASIKITNWVLVLVGEGILLSSLKNQVKKLDILDKTYFVGRKEGLELVSWYTLSQVFILPSTYEPFGAVVNEALLGGCKVLCSEVAGAASLINMDNGYLFSPYDKKELSLCIENTLSEVESTKENIVNIRPSKMTNSFNDKITVTIIQL